MKGEGWTIIRLSAAFYIEVMFVLGNYGYGWLNPRGYTVWQWFSSGFFAVALIALMMGLGLAFYYIKMWKKPEVAEVALQGDLGRRILQFCRRHENVVGLLILAPLILIATIAIVIVVVCVALVLIAVLIVGKRRD